MPRLYGKPTFGRRFESLTAFFPLGKIFFSPLPWSKRNLGSGEFAIQGRFMGMGLLLLFATVFSFWSIWCALERRAYWWLLSVVLYLTLLFGYKYLTGNNFWGEYPLT